MIFDLTPKHWAIAAMLGEARRRTNEKTRHKSRDRGHDKNVLGDMMGALGEIVALEYYRDQMTQEAINMTRQHMLVSGSGRTVKGADLITSRQRLDVKTFDCAPNKRFFAINAAKHQQLSGECDGYFALLAPRYGRQALLIDILPYEAVSNWACKPLGSYGDPSYNCPLQALLASFAGHNEYQNTLNAGCYERSEIGFEMANTKTRQDFVNDFPQSVSLLSKVA